MAGVFATSALCWLCVVLPVAFFSSFLLVELCFTCSILLVEDGLVSFFFSDPQALNKRAAVKARVDRLKRIPFVFMITPRVCNICYIL